MSDTNELQAVKLTKAQRELLVLLSEGPRDGITDRRIANALGLKGLCTFEAASDTWTITDAGLALSTSDARAPSVEEGKHG